MQRISIPILIRGLSAQTCNPWLTICQCLAILAATVVVALILARYASNRWLGDRQAVKCGFVGLSVIYALLLFGTFGFTPHTVRGILLCLILLTASYSDIKSREVADYLSVMVLLTSFVGCNMAQLPGMLFGGLFVFTMMLVVSLMGRESCIGGADIKLGSACAFALGIQNGTTGLILGLLLAVVLNLFKGKSTRHQSFPMIPYLSAGFLAAYFF
jgi:prepilin signal peptidase PulO-like enzyme (type II secretory pathway)